MIIDWRVIPHKEQRYPTVGDWWWGDMEITTHPTLHIRVSKMSDHRYELLVGLHEVIEVLLCRFAAINPADIDAFDGDFERVRAELLKDRKKHALELPCGCDLKQAHALEYEPGDDLHAPYHQQHQIASVCERALAFFLGVNWEEYEREVESL